MRSRGPAPRGILVCPRRRRKPSPGSGSRIGQHAHSVVDMLAMSASRAIDLPLVAVHQLFSVKQLKRSVRLLHFQSIGSG